MHLGSIYTDPSKHACYEPTRDSCLPASADVRQITSCSFGKSRVRGHSLSAGEFSRQMLLALVFMKWPFLGYLSNIPYLLQYHLFLFSVVFEFQADLAQYNSLGQTFFLSGVFSSCLGYFSYCPKVC